jgi:hypothetical protein
MTAIVIRKNAELPVGLGRGAASAYPFADMVYLDCFPMPIAKAASVRQAVNNFVKSEAGKKGGFAFKTMSTDGNGNKARDKAATHIEVWCISPMPPAEVPAKPAKGKGK